LVGRGRRWGPVPPGVADSRRFIKVDEDSSLELHAYLQHVEAGRLGFAVQHVDRENLQPLLEVLQAHMDLATLEEELALLGS